MIFLYLKISKKYYQKLINFLHCFSICKKRQKNMIKRKKKDVQSFSAEEKGKRLKRSKKDIKIFLKNKNRSYLSVCKIII